ncbi:MAG: STAS domain-containing protein [Planctomycetes bacterium]|nr:STAS domain-containing protein [Planctomycetota bacterium]
MSGATILVVEIETLPDGFALRPKGDVDMARSPALRAKLTESLKSKPGRLVVDLSDVPYMDSSGLATLIEALQTTRKNQIKFIICNLSPRVRSILEIARLTTVFTVVENREQALQA